MNKGELVEVEETSMVSNTFALVDVNEAKAFMDNYQEVCKALLDSSDYQKVVINGKERAFKKKSAWRKIQTAFNISDDILEKEIIRDDNHQIISATFYVKATAPNGRSGVGSASCSIFDKIKASDAEQPSNFELRKRFNNAENDVIATAHTRAKSRAISDLAGMGELSAEELEEMEVIPKKQKVSVTPKKKKESKPKKTVKPKAKAKVKPKKPAKDDEAIEVEVVESKKKSMTIKDLMDTNNTIKMAVREMQDKGLSVNRDKLREYLENKHQVGGITNEDYEEIQKLME